MAFIRLITRNYKIVAEYTIKEDESLRPYFEKNPSADVALCWTDEDLRIGYDHPATCPSPQYLQNLKDHNLY